MKKIILLTNIFYLTACGGDSNDVNIPVAKRKYPLKLYAIDASTAGGMKLGSPGLYVNGKTYMFDNNKLFLNYENLPIFRTEVMRQILTSERYFSNKSLHLHKYEYKLGDQASYDGQKLSYRIKNDNEYALLLSWDLEKINVTGRQFSLDLNNPIHQINKDPMSSILFAVFKLGYGDLDVFPEGSICWQKKYAYASEDFIEFFPNRTVEHVSETNKILRTNVWAGVEWTEYERNEKESELANIKVQIEDKIYWGWYQEKTKALTFSPNEFKCDFMNEIAYKAAITKLRLPSDEASDNESAVTPYNSVWPAIYLDASDYNPPLQKNSLEKP